MEAKKENPQERSLYPAQVWRFINQVVNEAALNAFLLAKPDLSEASARRILENGPVLDKAVEQAVSKVLLALGMAEYPILSETRLLKPVATALVPTLATAEELKEFCRTSLRTRVSQKLLTEYFNLELEQITTSITRCPYVACALKKTARVTEIGKELPEKYLSRFTDIIAFVFAQRNGEPGFLNNEGDLDRFLIKGKDGEVLVMEVSADINGHVWYLSSFDFESTDAWRSDKCRFLCPGVAFL